MGGDRDRFVHCIQRPLGRVLCHQRLSVHHRHGPYERHHLVDDVVDMGWWLVQREVFRECCTGLYCSDAIFPLHYSSRLGVEVSTGSASMPPKAAALLTWPHLGSYTGTSIDADVAFDTFLSSSCSSTTDEYEVMIWLAALGGAGPISSTGSTIATPSIAGYTWSLYYGLNGDMQVYSFVAPSEITSFDANIMLFFDYLTSNEGVPTSSCLIDLQAGTEPFTGTSAVLSSNYYVTI